MSHSAKSLLSRSREKLVQTLGKVSGIFHRRNGKPAPKVQFTIDLADDSPSQHVAIDSTAPIHNEPGPPLSRRSIFTYVKTNYTDGSSIADYSSTSASNFTPSPAAAPRARRVHSGPGLYYRQSTTLAQRRQQDNIALWRVASELTPIAPPRTSFLRASRSPSSWITVPSLSPKDGKIIRRKRASSNLRKPPYSKSHVKSKRSVPDEVNAEMFGHGSTAEMPVIEEISPRPAAPRTPPTVSYSPPAAPGSNDGSAMPIRNPRRRPKAGNLTPGSKTNIRTPGPKGEIRTSRRKPKGLTSGLSDPFRVRAVHESPKAQAQAQVSAPRVPTINIIPPQSPRLRRWSSFDTDEFPADKTQKLVRADSLTWRLEDAAASSPVQLHSPNVQDDATPRRWGDFDSDEFSSRGHNHLVRLGSQEWGVHTGPQKPSLTSPPADQMTSPLRHADPETPPPQAPRQRFDVNDPNGFTPTPSRLAGNWYMSTDTTNPDLVKNRLFAAQNSLPTIQGLRYAVRRAATDFNALTAENEALKYAVTDAQARVGILEPELVLAWDGLRARDAEIDRLRALLANAGVDVADGDAGAFAYQGHIIYKVEADAEIDAKVNVERPRMPNESPTPHPRHSRVGEWDERQQ